MSAVEPRSILIINPNSSESITSALKPLLADITHPGLLFEFCTGPPTAPSSIDDEATSDLSTSATLPILLPLLAQYSACLVACFSPHPLTSVLRTRTVAPVLNIFEASLLHARALARPFGIVTTGKYWESVLREGAKQFFHGPKEQNPENGVHVHGFVGVRSTGLTASQLHSTPREEVNRRIAEASAELARGGAEVIILGCAGMSGMEDAVRHGARGEGKNVAIVDGVRAGVVMLEGLLRAQVPS